MKGQKTLILGIRESLTKKKEQHLDSWIMGGRILHANIPNISIWLDSSCGLETFCV